MPEPVGQQPEHQATESIEITVPTAENMPEPVGQQTEQDSHQDSERQNTSSPSETTEIMSAETRTRESTETTPHKSKKIMSQIRSKLAHAFAKDSPKVAPTAAVAIPNDSAIEIHQNPTALIYHPGVRAAIIKIIQQKVSRPILDPNAGTPAAIMKMMASMPKVNKEAYFGRPLAAYADLPGVDCPGFVHRCVEWLLAGDHRKTFGIFREATFPHAQKGMVAAYLAAPGAPLVVPDTPGVNPATTVACALKAFLVQLQEPLIPADLYATCLAMDCPQDVDALRLTLACLPRFQQRTIQALLRCAAAVSREEASNRMSSAALATCLAPCLLRPQELNHVDAAEASKHARALVEFMIDNVELLFMLPEGFQLPEPVLVPQPAETNLSKKKRKTRTFGLWKKLKKILA
ncbi:Rho GTPase activation protein [Gaertneriomyces semiglobifer]|nr:Rho GTPase activation protein [Gaertneriomyces semiglobifer]